MAKPSREGDGGENSTMLYALNIEAAELAQDIERTCLLPLRLRQYASTCASLTPDPYAQLYEPLRVAL